MKTYLAKVMQGQYLSSTEAQAAMRELCSLERDAASSAAFLAALHLRGESQEELLGFVSYLRSEAIALPALSSLQVIDTCGTGGDYKNTFNISTASALLLASLGVLVAKHGGRAVSSLSGSAEVLAALGIAAEKEPALVLDHLQSRGFVFLHAPLFNVALQNVASLRHSLSVRTCFNLLGPLLNPLRPSHQVLGVYSATLLEPVAKLLRDLGVEGAMVIHAEDGLDEFSIAAPTEVMMLKEGELSSFRLDPKALGIKHSSLEALKGGSPLENAAMIKRIFAGVAGPLQEALSLNAAAALLLLGRVHTFEEGLALCLQALQSGQAQNYLQALVQRGELR